MLIATLISLFGCRSVDYVPSQDTIVYKLSDITITLTPLSQENLISSYGKNENPFINYPGRLPHKTFVVFDVEIRSQNTILESSRRNMELILENVVIRGENKESLTNAWNHYFSSDRQELHMKKTIRELLREDMFTVTPDNPFQGLIVFLIPLKETSDALLRIPAKTSGGDEGIIEIPIKMLRFQNGELVMPEENSGIFNQ